MIIDKTNKVTKTMGMLCTISATIGLLLTVRGFGLYRFVVTIANAGLAFSCFKDLEMDKDLCVGIFGIFLGWEVIRILKAESLTVSTGSLMIMLILGYASIIAYLTGIIEWKIIPTIGGTLVSAILLRHIYDVILAYQNFQNVAESLGMFNYRYLVDIVVKVSGFLTYIVPTLTMVILIATGAIIIEK